MSKIIKLGSCLDKHNCKHFVYFEDSTNMMSGYEIYNNREIYDTLNEDMKKHFYECSDEYKNIDKKQREEEINKINEMKREIHYKFLNIKDEEIKECTVYDRCIETFPCQHTVNVIYMNDNVYKTTLFSTDIYKIKPIYNRLSSDMKKHIDKEISEKEKIEKELMEKEQKKYEKIVLKYEKQMNTLHLLSSLYKDKPSKISLYQQCLNIEEHKKEDTYVEYNFKMFNDDKDNYFKCYCNQCLNEKRQSDNNEKCYNDLIKKYEGVSTFGEILQVIQNFVEAENQQDCAKKIYKLTSKGYDMDTECFIDKMLNIVSEYISKK